MRDMKKAPAYIMTLFNEKISGQGTVTASEETAVFSIVEQVENTSFHVSKIGDISGLYYLEMMKMRKD